MAANCAAAVSMSWILAKLVAVLFVGIGCLFFLAKLGRLRRERSELWAFSQRLLESQENEGKRLAAELHGNLDQNLLIIKNRAELGLTPGTTGSAMAEQLKVISEVCSLVLDETGPSNRNQSANARPIPAQAGTGKPPLTSADRPAIARF